MSSQFAKFFEIFLTTVVLGQKALHFPARRFGIEDLGMKNGPWSAVPQIRVRKPDNFPIWTNTF